MDDALIARLRDGDPSATTPVRNNLRGVAARVISAPQWGRSGAPDPELERAAAAEAMAGESTTAVAVAGDAMAAAARLSLERWRKGAVMEGDGHLEPALVVGLAMERASANQAAHAKAHLESCLLCRRQIELVHQALKSAATAAELVAPITQDGELDQLLQAAGQEALGDEGRPAAPGRRPRPRPARPPPRDNSALRPLLLIALVLGAATWWSQRLTHEEQSWKVAALLPPELPPLGRAALYDGDVRDALVMMAEDGECRRAANVLHREWLRDSSDPLIRWYEGLALVCLRDGRRAVHALRDVEALADPIPFGMDWWIGQALLLDGDTEAGLRRLGHVARSDHPRAAQAQALIAAVEEME